MEITDDDRELICQVPQFAGLAPETLEKVIAGGTVYSYPRGVMLFLQGDLATCLHILLSGEVGLIGEHDGEETVVEIMSPGEMIVAAAVLTNQPCLMGAKVLQPARVLLLPAETFRAHLHAEPDLAIAMLAGVSRQFRMLAREIKSLKLKSSAQRLAGYLLDLAPAAGGRAVVRLPHSKSVIAARIGIRPETLSRHFSSLQEVGVRVRGSAVEIDSISRLTKFSRTEADRR